MLEFYFESRKWKMYAILKLNDQIDYKKINIDTEITTTLRHIDRDWINRLHNINMKEDVERKQTTFSNGKYSLAKTLTWKWKSSVGEKFMSKYFFSPACVSYCLSQIINKLFVIKFTLICIDIQIKRRYQYVIMVNVSGWQSWASSWIFFLLQNGKTTKQTQKVKSFHQVNWSHI